MFSLPGQSFPVWICSSGTGRSRFTYWAYAHDPTNRSTFLAQLSKQGMATRPTGSQPVSLKFESLSEGLKSSACPAMGTLRKYLEALYKSSLGV